MNSLSSYISGRTPGGGGRGGNNSQQQQDLRINRGGGSISNGRVTSRGRGEKNIIKLFFHNLFFRWT